MSIVDSLAPAGGPVLLVIGGRLRLRLIGHPSPGLPLTGIRYRQKSGEPTNEWHKGLLRQVATSLRNPL